MLELLAVIIGGVTLGTLMGNILFVAWIKHQDKNNKNGQ